MAEHTPDQVEVVRTGRGHTALLSVPDGLYLGTFWTGHRRPTPDEVPRRIVALWIASLGIATEDLVAIAAIEDPWERLRRLAQAAGEAAHRQSFRRTTDG